MCFPHLLAPGKIGTLTLKNRIVQGPAELQASGFNGEMSDDYIDFYEESARAGTGLIITAYASVDDEFSQSFAGCQLKLTDRRHCAGLSKLARRVHKYGAKVIVQAYMAGRQAVPTEITGKRMVAPSPLGYSWHNQIPEEMTREEIHGAVRKFGRAASILQDSGIDGIEILAAGGYLVNQFLSPKSNIRTDEYGGSFENRTRFVREVVEEIRRVCGPDFTLGIRFTVDEFLDGGYGLAEGVEFARFFESLGVDYLNINNSNQEKRYYIIEPVGMDTGWKSYIIEAVKKAVSIPVLATNVIKTPEQAEAFLAAGLMDYAVMARAFLADPEWSRKAIEGRTEEVRPCIGCLYCLEQTAKFRRSICAVNPTLLRRDEFPDRGHDLAGKKILVVGAGPAGLEAAIGCRRRGALVTVYEKSDKPGGALLLAAAIPHKEPLRQLADYYAAMARRLEIPILLGTEITAEEILAQQPYAVFLAVGAESRVIPGLEPDGSRIFTMDEVLSRRLTFPGKNVAVIGGGMNACEMAEYCALSGSRATQVVRRSCMSANVDPDCLFPPLHHLAEAGGTVLYSHRPVKLADGALTVEHSETGVQDSVPADVLVLAVGSRPRRGLADALRARLKNVIVLGDADHVSRVADAVRSGFERAYVLE